MVKRLLLENIWSLSVPVSATCIALAVLIGPGASVTPTLAWLGLALAYAGVVVFLPVMLRRTGFAIQIRAHHLVINLVWAAIVFTLGMTGKLAPLTRTVEGDYYPGTDRAELVHHLSLLLRDRWLKADKDMYAVDTTEMLTGLHEDAETVIWIVPKGRDEAMIYLKRSDDLAWRYEISDIEDLDGEWIEPAPWDGTPSLAAEPDNTEWRPGEPIKRKR
jgi:hypothetical protein